MSFEKLNPYTLDDWLVSVVYKTWRGNVCAKTIGVSPCTLTEAQAKRRALNSIRQSVRAGPRTRKGIPTLISFMPFIIDIKAERASKAQNKIGDRVKAEMENFTVDGDAFANAFPKAATA